jgi:hypothetical protein
MASQPFLLSGSDEPGRQLAHSTEFILSEAERALSLSKRMALFGFVLQNSHEGTSFYFYFQS